MWSIRDVILEVFSKAPGETLGGPGKLQAGARRPREASRCLRQLGEAIGGWGRLKVWLVIAKTADLLIKI